MINFIREKIGSLHMHFSRMSCGKALISHRYACLVEMKIAHPISCEYANVMDNPVKTTHNRPRPFPYFPYLTSKIETYHRRVPRVPTT